MPYIAYQELPNVGRRCWLTSLYTLYLTQCDMYRLYIGVPISYTEVLLCIVNSYLGDLQAYRMPTHPTTVSFLCTGSVRRDTSSSHMSHWKPPGHDQCQLQERQPDVHHCCNYLLAGRSSLCYHPILRQQSQGCGTHMPY